MKTLKDIEPLGVSIPIDSEETDNDESLVTRVALRDAAREWAEKIIKDMVIDPSKIGPITTNERGILTIELGITSNYRAMDKAIGMLAFIKHFFNLEEKP